MAITLRNAYLGQPTDTGTNLYTCPANTVARVVKCVATNDTTMADTITFHKIPSGDLVGVVNLILNTYPLGSKETYLCPEVEGQILDAGDKIHALAGTNDQVTVSLDVVEIPQS